MVAAGAILVGSAAAAGGGEATPGAAADGIVRFYSDLPSNGGELLAEEDLAALGEGGQELGDARYAELALQDRSYAFPVHAATMADGEVRLGVRGHDTEGLSTVETNAGTAGQAPVRPVADVLASGLAGERDLILVARRDGDAYVVTYLAPRADVTDASTVEARESEEHVVVLLHDGRSTILNVVGDVRRAGELTVATEQGHVAVLDEGLWQGLAQRQDDDAAAGIGLPLED